MATDTLYYFFSSVSQTFGALLGVVGMLTVYRIQALRNYIDDTMRKYDRDIMDVIREDVIPSDLEEKWTHKKMKRAIPEDQGQWGENYKRIETAVISIKKFNRVIEGTKDRFVWFLISSVLTIFLSLGLLPFTRTLADTGWDTFFSGLVGILILASLWATVMLGLQLIETKWIEVWNRTKLNIREHNEKWNRWVVKHF